MKFTETQMRILKVFYETQFNEDSGYFNDETPLVSYKLLVKELGLSKEVIKPELIDLRNKGVVMLSMAVNYDYEPCGSGWMVNTTNRSDDMIRGMFFETPLSETTNPLT